MRKHLGSLVFIAVMTLVSFSFLRCQKKAKSLISAFYQWTETIEASNQTYRGVIDGLNHKDCKEGLNLHIDYKNVVKDKKLALKTAQDFGKN